MVSLEPLPCAHGFVCTGFEIGSQPCQTFRDKYCTKILLANFRKIASSYEVIQKGTVLLYMINPPLTHTYRCFFSPSLDLSVHIADSLTPDGSSQMPTLDIPLKFCAPRAFASGSSLGHVPAHLASPGDCGAAGALLHARLEPGDHWHLCPDRDGSWYGAFSLLSGPGGALQAQHVWSARHVVAMAPLRAIHALFKCDLSAEARFFNIQVLARTLLWLVKMKV